MNLTVKPSFLTRIITGTAIIATLSYAGIPQKILQYARTGQIQQTEINFEQAMAKPELRQIYLDRLVEKEATKDSPWQFFASVTYDPNFEKYQRKEKVDLKVLINTKDAYGGVTAKEGQHFETVALTVITKKKRKTTLLYVKKRI